MDNKIVSQTYFDACARIHRATDLLYESLHSDNGTETNKDFDKLITDIKLFREAINMELDLIREMCKESDSLLF